MLGRSWGEGWSGGGARLLELDVLTWRLQDVQLEALAERRPCVGRPRLSGRGEGPVVVGARGD